MNYFNLNNNIKKKDWINLRKKSQNINQDNFKRGDIITLTFWNKCYNYYLCLQFDVSNFFYDSVLMGSITIYCLNYS